jgi:hypothetical protein
MGESKFDKLADKIAKEYRKDGDSAEKAKEIGEATAAKIGFAKYGKRGMARKARAGMRAESFEAEYNLIGRRKPRKLSLKVSDLKEALENANDDADVFVGDITPVEEEMIGEPIVSAPRGVWTNGEEVYIVGATDWIDTDQIGELTWNRVDRAKDAESFGADELDKSKVVYDDKGNRTCGCRNTRIVDDCCVIDWRFMTQDNLHNAISNLSRIGYLEFCAEFDIGGEDAQEMSWFISKSYRDSEVWEWLEENGNKSNTEWAEELGAESFDAEGICPLCDTGKMDIYTELCNTCGHCAAGCGEWAGQGCQCLGAESFDAEKIEGQTQSNIYAKFFVGHVSNDELRGNGKFKTYDSAVKKAKEVAKKEGNSRVVSPMGAALWTSNDKGLFQAGHLTTEAKRFYNSEEEMATGYLSAESILYDAPISAYDEHCIHQGRFCVSQRLPGKNMCRNCDAEVGELFPQDAEYTALGVPMRRIPARDIMSPGARAIRGGLIVLATVMILSASAQGSPPSKEA